MNKLLTNAMLERGQLEVGKEYHIDFDRQTLRTASSRIVEQGAFMTKTQRDTCASLFEYSHIDYLAA